MILLSVIALAALAVFGIIKSNWVPLIVTIMVLIILFCLYFLALFLFEGGEKAEPSKVNVQYSGTKKIKIKCHQKTYSPGAFYIFFDKECVAEISRGNTLEMTVPDTTVRSAVTRNPGLPITKYYFFNFNDGDCLWIYPDPENKSFPYRLMVWDEEIKDDKPFEKLYEQESSEMNMIMLGMLAGGIMADVLIYFIILVPLL